MTKAPSLTCTWNGLSHLTGINDAVNRYNGLNRLVETTLSGETVSYAYCTAISTQLPLQITEGRQQWIQAVAPGWGLIYSIRIPTAGTSEAVYYHFDQRGSTVATTDGDGAVTGRFGYTPYGRMVNPEGPKRRHFNSWDNSGATRFWVWTASIAMAPASSTPRAVISFRLSRSGRI